MKLYFVRHGNTFNKDETPRQVGCKTDLPLTKEGHRQIQELNNLFNERNIHFEHCLCGPLKRHIQSGEILSKEIIIMHELNEIDYGKWENLTSTQIQNQWPKEFAMWQEQAIWPSHIFYGAQSAHIQNLIKLIEYIDNISNSFSSNILVVSSQGTIRYLLYLAENWESIVKNKLMEKYKVKPGHYCVIQRHKANLEIISWNNSYDLD
jgi:broad specificity phosphatase PhoE